MKYIKYVYAVIMALSFWSTSLIDYSFSDIPIYWITIIFFGGSMGYAAYVLRPGHLGRDSKRFLWACGLGMNGGVLAFIILSSAGNIPVWMSLAPVCTAAGSMFFLMIRAMFISERKEREYNLSMNGGWKTLARGTKYRIRK